ncbi:F-box protein [Quillaja saponaria]|uniref:F-box protein n=1 Tax=Quillaja saponaria TaxID=32244 RepID=A0AAD7PD01_QUISA|nr:F-box protein [Quillaja saponaria]
MGSSMDFFNWLDPDMSIKILMCLDDPADFVRVSSVSRSWCHSVIVNGLCKQLCLRMFPQLSRVASVVELNKHEAKEPVEVGSSYIMEWEALQRDHRVYAYLARASISSTVGNCISNAISASSTDYPEESIDNTLEPRDMVSGRPSYWSSKGQSNPAVPETLLYKLVYDFCVINEINILPFQAFFQMGYPIYSAKSVRFRMGHPKTSTDIKSSDLILKSSDASADNEFIWTYTSQEFPMAQENCLQKFKLPEPVLCIGGILQIELLGRVQRQEMDGLFYICVSHVQVVGRSLSPAFGVEILDSSGEFILKNDQLLHCPTKTSLSDNEPNAVSADYLQRQVRDLQNIVDLMQENVQIVEPLGWDGDEDDDFWIHGGADFEEEYAL